MKRTRRLFEVAVFAPLGAVATVAARLQRPRRPDLLSTPSPAPAAAETISPASARAATAVPILTAAVADADAVADDQLPIDGYDHLAASQVVDRLSALTPAELEAIADYERTHRHRQSVLAKVAQLQA